MQRLKRIRKERTDKEKRDKDQLDKFKFTTNQYISELINRPHNQDVKVDFNIVFTELFL